MQVDKAYWCKSKWQGGVEAYKVIVRRCAVSSFRMAAEVALTDEEALAGKAVTADEESSVQAKSHLQTKRLHSSLAISKPSAAVLLSANPRSGSVHRCFTASGFARSQLLRRQAPASLCI